jgi:hypothetical protein
VVIESAPPSLVYLSLLQRREETSHLTPRALMRLKSLHYLRHLRIEVSTSEQYNAILKNISSGIKGLEIFIPYNTKKITIDDEAFQHLKNRLHHLQKFTTIAENILNIWDLPEHVPPQVKYLHFPGFRVRQVDLAISLRNICEENCPNAVVDYELHESE